MSILLDINVLPSIFDRAAADHSQFEPVRACVLKSGTQIPIGGRKFRKELAKMPNYLRLYAQFERKGQIIRLNDAEVDDLAQDLFRLANDKDFDDEHLLAILVISRCPVICTKDTRAMRFIRMKALYPKKARRPSIYSGLKNQHLLKLV